MSDEEKINNTADMEEVIEKPDYESEILEIIRGKYSPKAMFAKLEDYHANDIAQAMETLDVQERKKIYRICSTAMLAEIFEYFDEASSYLNEMDMQKAAEVISELETDTAAEILRKIEKEKRAALIELLPQETRQEIQLISAFDDDEIGSRMTVNYIAIQENLSVKQAMKELISQAKQNDNISAIFAIDEQNEYSGAIDLKDLITADTDVPLDELIQTSFPYVYAHEMTADCIEKLKDYSEVNIPVLDNSNRLLGVITAANIIEAVDDEMGEDYAMLAGLTAEEDLKEPLKESMKKRMPWLLVLLALGMLVSGVVGVFEKVVAQLTLIMAFQSLILDMAGNVGTQSLAVTIRVLMDENLTGSQKFRLVTKEMKIGLANGLILGIISFLLIGIYIMLFKHKEIVFSFSVSGCIGISLLLAMMISGTVGTLIPLFFKKIKVDPAVASGPLITTINDLVAVVTYYGMSWILLFNVLHLA